MTPNIVVVGSLNMDLVVRAPRIPAPGETILGGHFQTFPGGKGANQAVAAARLGAAVSLVGCLGRDAFGDTLLENLADSGVNSDNVARDEGVATGVALIVVDEAGENSIVVASGANMKVDESQVEAAERVIAAAQVLVLQLEVALPAVMRAAQIAHQHGVPVVLNPAPARELPGEFFSLVDVLVPNESEAALLTGAEPGQAAHRLLERGVGSVVITMGGQGAQLTTRGQEPVQYDAFKIKPVDTTAAGDAFVAGLAVHMSAGHPLEDAIRWGNAAGALAAMRPGAQPSLPTRDEVERLISGENADKIIGESL